MASAMVFWYRSSCSSRSSSGWLKKPHSTSTAGQMGTRVTKLLPGLGSLGLSSRASVRLSMTDELTKLYNRRSFVEALAKLGEGELDSDLVVFSVDVNGLKTLNDTMGHAAGDELIKGAADCLALSVGQTGKVYRTGGDEFMAIVHTEKHWLVRDEIQQKARDWSGVYSNEMTLAIGYASRADNPDATAYVLEHRADANMYADKGKYYRETGIDRQLMHYGLSSVDGPQADA